MAVYIQIGASITLVINLVSSVCELRVSDHLLCFSRQVRGCVPRGKYHPSTSRSVAPMYEAVAPTVNRQQEQDVELKGM